jgi:hypothetical protein
MTRQLSEIYHEVCLASEENKSEYFRKLKENEARLSALARKKAP